LLEKSVQTNIPTPVVANAWTTVASVTL